jgi:hypothetical protein
MIIDNAPNQDFIPVDEELSRQLIEQFYEDSIGRYGIDSEQVRMLSRFRSRPGPDA